MSAIGRFYKVAAAQGFGVTLDGRSLRTPAKALFVAPTRALAGAIAQEWAAQGEQIAPLTMPLTRLAFTAIDRTPGQRAAIVAEIGRYLETDLICHRADGPAALVHAQTQSWDRWLDWAEHRLGARLACAAGIIALAQPAAAGASLRVIAEGLDDFYLTALADACTGLGSCVLALALCEGAFDPAAAIAAATIDEAYQLKTWGEDAQALAKLTSLGEQVDGLGRFLAALQGD